MKYVGTILPAQDTIITALTFSLADAKTTFIVVPKY
jgi:hypothetical protein